MWPFVCRSLNVFNWVGSSGERCSAGDGSFLVSDTRKQAVRFRPKSRRARLGLNYDLRGAPISHATHQKKQHDLPVGLRRPIVRLTAPPKRDARTRTRYLALAHAMQFVTAGLCSKRAGAIGSPQPRQYPYSPESRRASAASIAARSARRRRACATAMACICMASTRDNRPTLSWSRETGAISLTAARSCAPKS